MTHRRFTSLTRRARSRRARQHARGASSVTSNVDFSTLPQLKSPIRMHTRATRRAGGEWWWWRWRGVGVVRMTHTSMITPPTPHVPITHRRRTYHLDSTHILSTSWGTSHWADSRTPPPPPTPHTAGPVTSHESHLIRASFSIPLARIDDLI